MKRRVCVHGPKMWQQAAFFSIYSKTARIYSHTQAHISTEYALAQRFMHRIGSAECSTKLECVHTVLSLSLWLVWDPSANSYGFLSSLNVLDVFCTFPKRQRERRRTAAETIVAPGIQIIHLVLKMAKKHTPMPYFFFFIYIGCEPTITPCLLHIFVVFLFLSFFHSAQPAAGSQCCCISPFFLFLSPKKVMQRERRERNKKVKKKHGKKTKKSTSALNKFNESFVYLCDAYGKRRRWWPYVCAYTKLRAMIAV